MTEFTYEAATRHTSLEQYEWDNIWWDEPLSSEGRRIAYIGDSISCGTRRLATARSGGAYRFDGYGTSKALDHPLLEASVKLFLAQCDRPRAVLFNNGLHGWHLDEEAYAAAYHRMLAFLCAQVDVPVFAVLTTDTLGDSARGARVIARNRHAVQAAAALGCPVIDLYTVALAQGAWHTGDGIHFQTQGYEQLADCILQALTAHGI